MHEMVLQHFLSRIFGEDIDYSKKEHLGSVLAVEITGMRLRIFAALVNANKQGVLDDIMVG